MGVFDTNFTILDGIIIGVYLSGSLLVGIFVNRYIHNVTDYLVGGRASGAALNVATYIGTGLGLVTLMYASVDALSNGFSYVTLSLIGAIVGGILGSTGFVIQKFRRMELLTIPEYFEKRFNRPTRIVGGIICALAGILNMGLFPKMGATFIAYATGLGGDDGSHELLINGITTALILLVLIYTVLGGMVSVIVTDYIQFVVLSTGMGIGVWFCLTHPDLGWNNMLQTMYEHRGERMFNPVAHNSYGWQWIVFNFVIFLAAGIAWAPEASRTLTGKDEKVAKQTFLFSMPGVFARLAIPALWAVAAFCLIARSPELTAHFFPDGLAGDAKHASQAMPLAIGKILPTGLLGVLVAGLMAAFMSTHDSYFLCWSSVIARDIINPIRGGNMTDRQQILVTRISIVLIGLFLLVWGVWYETPRSIWNYMAVTGSIYLSGAFVVIVGGLYWKGASSAGALAGLLGGLFAIVGLFRESFNEMTGLSLTAVEVGLMTFVICGVLFVVFSLVIPDRGGQS